MKLDHSSPNKICPTCKGKGMTKATATVVDEVSPKVWVTKHLGSGCPDCLGLGIKGERNERRQ